MKYSLSFFTPTKENELDWENVCENDNFTVHSRFYENTVEYNTNSIKALRMSNSVSTRSHSINRGIKETNFFGTLSKFYTVI